MSATIWDRVVGQSAAVALLKAAAAEPVHAYLFVGPAGVGQAGGRRGLRRRRSCARTAARGLP